MPRFSILLPVHNDEHTLRDCLDSILLQTFTDYSVCIVINNSSDSSLHIIESHPLLKQSHVDLLLAPESINNLPLALNFGIASLSGKSDYIIRMDADDLMHPLRLEYTNSFLRNSDYKSLIHCGNAKFLSTRSILLRHPLISDFERMSFYLKTQLLVASPFVHPAIAFKNSVLAPYNPLFTYAQDLMFFVDNICNGFFSYDPRVYLYYRDPLPRPLKRELQLNFHDKAIHSLHHQINSSCSFFDSHRLRLSLVTDEYPLCSPFAPDVAFKFLKRLQSSLFSLVNS